MCCGNICLFGWLWLKCGCDEVVWCCCWFVVVCYCLKYCVMVFFSCVVVSLFMCDLMSLFFVLKNNVVGSLCELYVCIVCSEGLSSM